MRVIYSVVSLGLLAGLLTACGGGKEANIELIQDMMVSPAHKAQDENEAGESTMRVPPEHTLPIGHKRYRFGPAEVEEAGRELKNPLGALSTAEVASRGKNRYDIYCSVCHGDQGRGDGPVAAKMPVRPPSLVNAKIQGWRDGSLYHVIMQGKGVMGSYVNQIPKESDRWAVVNYIRSLQKIAN